MAESYLFGMQPSLDLASVFVLNAMNQMEIGTISTGVIARDTDHAAFIAKSEYMLPQLATRITFIKLKGLLIPVADGSRVLFESLFREVAGGFESLRMDSKTYSELERLAE